MDGTDRAVSLRRLAAWGAALLIVGVYLALPDAEEAGGRRSDDDAGEELERLEIRDVTPSDPYVGSSIRIRYAGERADQPIRAYGGRTELRVVAQRADELIALLPHELEPGAFKIRIAQARSERAESKPERSKPYFIRIKQPNPRKIFRNLVGGSALVAIGIVLLSRGLRASTGITGARTVMRATRLRSVSYLFGIAAGAIAQSTTSAASVLAALAASGLLSLASAAIAFVGAQAGASIAPLLIAGLLEPREGLIAVTIGAIGVALGADRRAAALGRLILGAGFVAFGVQVFRPGLEPFISDGVLLSFADHLRADTLFGASLCTALGTALVFAMQGPAPLLVLILAVAQTTGRWDLAAALSLLAGTGFGAALGALVTASGGEQPRKLARLHLAVGAFSTLIAALSVRPWTAVVELVLGSDAVFRTHAPRAELFDSSLPLALGFGLTQLTVAVLAALLTKGLERSLRKAAPPGARDKAAPRDFDVRTVLGSALALEADALEALSLLARTGSRQFGQRAEHALRRASAELELVTRSYEARSAEAQAISAEAVFACISLQRSLEALLRRIDRVTEARLALASESEPGVESEEYDRMLHELHKLVIRAFANARRGLLSAAPVDLDEARDAEIRINMLEARARRALRDGTASRTTVTEHLQALEVVDGYEVVGNQIYRLSEAITQPPLMNCA